MRITLVSILLSGLWLSAGSAWAQNATEIPNPDPELERRTFQVAPGFEVNLFAADPLLAKPIQMNFDPAGRLWVATSELYPQILPGQKANDKIIILTDTKGVGRADKISVFADGLMIPTGVAPGNGGAYVANSTELLHLSDTDGDGKADTRRVILSGFGTEDTHHILHTLQWGPEGFLYFNQSIYIHSHIETPYGVRRLGAGGIWQFRPDNLQLEVLARGFVNSWGHQLDAWGQSFATDGAYGEGINYIVPGAYYVTAAGASRILGGMNPGSPKHCGLEIVSGRGFPSDWQGNMITNDFRGHRVCRFAVTPEGSGYTSQEMPEVIKSAHQAFRPVDVKMGPDGALYIADWYNPIIQHGEVDFRDPRRDHTRGRIWRVTAKDRPPLPALKLVSASTTDLLEALKAPEAWTRTQAKRVLYERGPVVVAALDSWVQNLDPHEPNHEHNTLQALWTYQTLGIPKADLLKKMLKAKDHRVRAAATRVLNFWYAQVENAFGLTKGLLADPHPQVRLEAVRTIAKTRSPESLQAALGVLDLPMDNYLDYALWLTVRELEPNWFPSFRAGTLDLSKQPRKLIFALKAIASAEVARPLMQMLEAGKLPRDQETEVLTLVASVGNPAELEAVVSQIIRKPGPKAVDLTRILDALEQAINARKVKPAGDLGRIAQFFQAQDLGVRERAMRLAGRWKLEGLRRNLTEQVLDNKAAASVQLAAIDGLAYLGGGESIRKLDELVRGKQAISLRSHACAALASLDLKKASACAVFLLGQNAAGWDPDEVVKRIVQQKKGPEALTTALTNATISTDLAKLALRSLRTSGRENPELLEAITKAGKLNAKRVAPDAKQLADLVQLVIRNGNESRGESIYRRKDLSCIKCHAISGVGGLVGPDLGSIGASAPVDYLIESILVPNKAVKENYHSWLVATKEGRFYTGIKVREANGELVLRDAEDREIRIPAASIDEKTIAPSLMPEGLTDNLTQPELLDLVRFLSELGKVGSLKPAPPAMVRRWQALEATPAARTLLARTTFASAAGQAPELIWSSLYGKVNGELPAADIPTLKLGSGNSRQIGFLRCEIETTTPGKALARPSGVKPLSAWLGPVPLSVTAPLTLKLARGRNVLTLAYDLTDAAKGLQLEIVPASDSAARFQVIGGK